MSIPIAKLPSPDRPRERLDRLGASALSDRELLALVLRTGGRGQSALELADSLLAESGGLPVLAMRRVEELSSAAHLGPAKAAALVAAFELGRRVTLQDDCRPKLEGPEDIARVVTPLLQGKPHEEAVVVVLNSANRAIKTVALSSGGADRCLILPRDVLAAVLRHDGTAFAVAHNHPSGDPTPSRADLQVTRAIARAAESSGLKFIDHIVIGSSDWQGLRSGTGSG